MCSTAFLAGNSTTIQLKFSTTLLLYYSTVLNCYNKLLYLGEQEADDGRAADVVDGHARVAGLVDFTEHIEGELVRERDLGVAVRDWVSLFYGGLLWLSLGQVLRATPEGGASGLSFYVTAAHPARQRRLAPAAPYLTAQAPGAHLWHEITSRLSCLSLEFKNFASTMSVSTDILPGGGAPSM